MNNNFLNEIICLLRTIADRSCTVTNMVTTAGVGNVPAGLKSVAIIKTSPNTDSVTITLSDGTTYVMTEPGEQLADAADAGSRLPAYTASGAGVIKWHGIK